MGGRTRNLLSPKCIQPVDLSVPLVNFDTPALAVIDGTLCRLTREGARAAGHPPLATAVLEFRHGSLRYYVREHPHGLLPGLPNLYCLDATFRLQWMADWPESSDPCIAILGEEGDTVVAQSASGMIVRLDANTGRLLRVEQLMAAAV
jgi:outer membrane protein assembly factor BamB